MNKNVKVVRLVSGEIVIFKDVTPAVAQVEASVVSMQNPFMLVNTNQGPSLAPMMPWATKETDYTISMPASHILFHFPEENSDPVIQSYIQATSRLDLSGLSNVSPLTR